jgi:hypothetical protein
MGSVEAADSTILRPAVYHLLGLPEGLRDAVQPFVDTARATLQAGAGSLAN